MNVNLIINAENMDQIDDLCNMAQKRARTRIIDADMVARYAERVYNYKENHCLAWTHLEGCKFQFSTYENMPNSYKYKISFSRVYITIEKRQIKLIAIDRLEDYNHKANTYCASVKYMTDYCKEKLLENMSRVK